MTIMRQEQRISAALPVHLGKSILAPEYSLEWTMKTLYVCYAVLGLVVAHWVFRRQPQILPETDHVARLRASGLL